MTTLKAEIENRKQVRDTDNVQALLFAAATAEKSNNSVWHTLVCMYVSEKFDNPKTMSAFLTDNMPPSLVDEAPMTKNGRIKFRSWGTTKNLWKYASIVFKAVENHGGNVDEVFPEDEPIPTLATVKKAAYGEKKKSTLSPVEKFRVACNNAAAAYNGATDEEMREMDAILQTMPFSK